ncbi:hypothetical protein [Nevskia ramosa]|uniref:hypothetical protein n=1 Tax=Nevskia ramosa TaxID=64002 RepID=UPI002352A180|nr:hypothetical protein [Nevskia ramosa]
MQASDRPSWQAVVEDLKAKDAARRRSLLKGAATAVLAATAGFTTVFIALVITFDAKSNRQLLEARSDANRSLASDLVEFRERLEAAEKRIKVISAPVPGVSVSAEQQKLAAQLQSVDERLKRIETAILDSPERALSIPLLRKDFDEGSKRIEEYRTANRVDVDRLYDQQKWILGGIGTVLLGVIGGAITLILKSLPKPGKEQAQST